MKTKYLKLNLLTKINNTDIQMQTEATTNITTTLAELWNRTHHAGFPSTARVTRATLT